MNVMANKQVNPELYDFLNENETGLFREKDTIVAYVHIYFFRLEDFVKIIGVNSFDEGGIDVKMFSDTVCVELNSIIEAFGHDLSSYKKCFSEWNEYESEILKQEQD
jgi:hypothetical protein